MRIFLLLLCSYVLGNLLDYPIVAQEVDQQRYELILQMSVLLKTAAPEDISRDSLLLLMDTSSDYIPALDSALKRFRQNEYKILTSIKDLRSERDAIKLDRPFIKLEGTVGSRLGEYAIVISRGAYWAVRTNVEVGNIYKGSIKAEGKTINYQPQGGTEQSINTYIPTTVGSPSEESSHLTDKINQLESQYGADWEIFRVECFSIIENARMILRQELLGRYYSMGESFYNVGKYDSAVHCFRYVQSLDSDYMDVSVKLSESINDNHLVRQSDVVAIVRPKGDVILAATSQGIFESTDEGRKWKLVTMNGKSFQFFDAIDTLMLGYVQSEGIVFSSDRGNSWKTLSVEYDVKYDKQINTQNLGVTFKRIRVHQPDYDVINLRIAKRDDAYILYIGYAGRSGLAVNGDKRMLTGQSIFEKNYNIKIGNFTIEIPEKCVSVNYGTQWIPYWDGLLGKQYHSPEVTPAGLGDILDYIDDYCQYPEDAVEQVIDYNEKTKRSRDGDIKVVGYSIPMSAEKRDSDPVLVLTNHGLFKTCWDCNNIMEIPYPTTYGEPRSVYSDQQNLNLIMIGLKTGGIIISRDGGSTWDTM